MADQQPSDDQASNGANFEHSLAELESNVHDLEEGQLGLAEALGRYEQGVKHLKHCYQILEAAERKIELLTGVAEDGSPCTEAFDESQEPLTESVGRRRRARKAAQKPPEEADDRDVGA